MASMKMFVLKRCFQFPLFRAAFFISAFPLFVVGVKGGRESRVRSGGVGLGRLERRLFNTGSGARASLFSACRPLDPLCWLIKGAWGSATRAQFVFFFVCLASGFLRFIVPATKMGGHHSGGRGPFVPTFDGKGSSFQGYEQRVALWNRTTEIQPDQRASQLVPHMEPLARQICLQSGGDSFMNGVAATEVLQVLKQYFSPDASDHAYLDVWEFLHHSRTDQTIGPMRGECDANAESKNASDGCCSGIS